MKDDVTLEDAMAVLDDFYNQYMGADANARFGQGVIDHQRAKDLLESYFEDRETPPVISTLDPTSIDIDF